MELRSLCKDSQGRRCNRHLRVRTAVDLRLYSLSVRLHLARRTAQSKQDPTACKATVRRWRAGTGRDSRPPKSSPKSSPKTCRMRAPRRHKVGIPPNSNSS